MLEDMSGGKLVNRIETFLGVDVLIDCVFARREVYERKIAVGFYHRYLN